MTRLLATASRISACVCRSSIVRWRWFPANAFIQLRSSSVGTFRRRRRSMSASDTESTHSSCGACDFGYVVRSSTAISSDAANFRAVLGYAPRCPVSHLEIESLATPTSSASSCCVCPRRSRHSLSRGNCNHPPLVSCHKGTANRLHLQGEVLCYQVQRKWPRRSGRSPRTWPKGKGSPWTPQPGRAPPRLQRRLGNARPDRGRPRDWRGVGGVRALPLPPLRCSWLSAPPRC